MGLDVTMIAVCPGDPPTDEDIAGWSRQLTYSIGDKNFFEKPLTRHEELELNPGEFALSVNHSTRYYGVGYERGDILTICAIAEWLEYRLSAVVYYGNDSDVVCYKNEMHHQLHKFDAPARLELRNHLYSDQGRGYFDRWNALLASDGRTIAATKF